ncbi:hypothetical protein D3C79_964000 [compost metagenome]
MRIEVVCVLAARQVGQGDWRRLVLGVDAQKLIDIPPLVYRGLSGHRIIVAAFWHDAEQVIVGGLVERVPSQ